MEQLVKPISIALKAVKDGPPSSSQPHAFLRIVWKRASIIAVSQPLSINLAQFGLRGGALIKYLDLFAFKARNTLRLQAIRFMRSVLHASSV